MTARFIIGDVRAVLDSLPADSVDLVLTSPPFLALRSYLPADHPDKALEIGSEATPGEFIDTLLDVVEACERVLAPHGSMCFELGDTYSGSGGAGGDYHDGGLRDGQERFSGSAAKRAKGGVGDDYRPPRNDRRDGWPLDKSLCLVPEIFRFSLVYGFNPLTGRRTPRWRARNVVRWCRPNPPVGALGDKFRPGTSEMVVVCKSRTRYFDLDAVRTEPTVDASGDPEVGMALASKGISGGDSGHPDKERLLGNPAGAPPLDWWKISTQGYEGSHYATFPEKLCETPIKAMCPQRVCTTCGEPSRRITETANALGVATGRRSWRADPTIGGGHTGEITKKISSAPTADVRTIGWTDCGHDTWRTGLVLDPFAGSGTTLAVATGHGRDAIGIDLDSRNAALALDRVGPLLLTVEHLAPTKGAA